MYREYEYQGETAVLQHDLENIIQGLLKIRSSVPKQIGRYFPNGQTDYQQVIGSLDTAIQNCTQLIQSLGDPAINKDHIVLGIAYMNDSILKQLMDIVTLPVGKRYAARILKQDAKLIAINKMFKQIVDSQIGFATLRKRHDNYKRVMSVIQYIGIENVDEVGQRLQKMGNLLNMTNAAIIQSFRHQSKFMEALSLPFNLLRYMVDSNQAQIMVANYLRKPDCMLMQRMWNFAETQCIVARGMKCMFRPVRTVKKIHIPRRQIAPGEMPDIYTKDQNTIQIRIISTHPIQLYERSQCCGCLCCKSCLCCRAQISDNTPDFETIMIHIHGGGFVALSSFSMQSHTRLWADALDIPIFSIDYRLSPQSAFPDALDDCWYAYMFIINEAFKHMNVRPKKIIIAGDSAGGNLTLALTGLLMKRQVSLLPYGIFLAYPATDFREIFSPSRLNSLDDTLLFTSLLFVCRQAYLNKQVDKNPLISPILITEGWVNGDNDTRWPLRWPRTRLIVGENDPLFDDSFCLLERMTASQVDVEAKVYQGMGHGLLSLEVFVPQCRLVIQHSILLLRELLT